MLRRVGNYECARLPKRPADWKSAIQQITNLRYETAWDAKHIRASTPQEASEGETPSELAAGTAALPPPNENCWTAFLLTLRAGLVTSPLAMASPPPAVELENLTRRFGDVIALDHVT